MKFATNPENFKREYSNLDGAKDLWDVDEAALWHRDYTEALQRQGIEVLHDTWHGLECGSASRTDATGRAGCFGDACRCG